MRPSWTASAALAISISFRTAGSGSLNGLGSANFTGFVLGGDVRDVDQVFLEAVTVEDIAARAFQIDAAWLPGLPFVRRQPLPRVPQGVLPRGPIPLITPRLEISLGSVCQKHFPRGFEIGTRLVERGSGAVLVFAWMRAWIKAAAPLPRILIMGAARADRDRSDVDIAVVNLPAFLAGIGRSAAGKLGHVPSKLTLWRPANSPTGWARNSCQLLPIAGVDKLAGGRPCLTFRMAQYWAGKRVLRSDGAAEARNGSFGKCSQKCLQLAKEHLDWIQIR